MPKMLMLWLCLLPLAAQAQPSYPPRRPEAGLSLAQAQALALAHHPELAVAQLELQAQDGAWQQAGSRPNPQLEVQLEDVRAGRRSTTWQWIQPLELGGKREARLSVATQARELAALALQDRQAQLMAEVAQAYVGLIVARQQVELARQAWQLAAQVSDLAVRRVAAGKVAPLEQDRAQLAQASAQLQLAQAQGEQDLALQRLQALCGPEPLDLPGPEQAPALPALPTPRWVGERLAQAPLMQLSQRERQRRAAQVQLQRAQRVSDLTISLGAKREAGAAGEGGRSMAVLGLSLALPLLDRNEGGLREALARERQAEAAMASTRLQLQTEVEQALEQLRQARDQVAMLARQALPLAQRSHAAALQGYELGKLGFAEVLEAQRGLTQVHQQQSQAQALAHRAAAQLQRWLGEALPVQEQEQP